MSTSSEKKALSPEAARAYWRGNLTLMAVLLTVWFVVSFGFGVLLKAPLDRFHVGGAPLGFWFAQQGSIYVFVALIFVYCLRMNALERKHGIEG